MEACQKTCGGISVCAFVLHTGRLYKDRRQATSCWSRQFLALNATCCAAPNKGSISHQFCLANTKHNLRRPSLSHSILHSPASKTLHSRKRASLALQWGVSANSPQPGNANVNETFDHHSMPQVTSTFVFPELRVVS